MIQSCPHHLPRLLTTTFSNLSTTTSKIVKPTVQKNVQVYQSFYSDDFLEKGKASFKYYSMYPGNIPREEITTKYDTEFGNC